MEEGTVGGNEHEAQPLPPYNLDLNPIDTIWSGAKNWVASYNKMVMAEKVIKRCLAYSSYILI